MLSFTPEEAGPYDANITQRVIPKSDFPDGVDDAEAFAQLVYDNRDLINGLVKTDTTQPAPPAASEERDGTVDDTTPIS